MQNRDHPDNRLLTVPEIFARYPKAFFNDLGELIYVKKTNHYVIPTMLHKLGTKTKGWRGDLYLFPFDEHDSI